MKILLACERYWNLHISEHTDPFGSSNLEGFTIKVMKSFLLDFFLNFFFE
jgi:hypothetical protein